jgi:hypothetical protein
MILKFEEWLIHQQDREDFVGDLARALVASEIIIKPSGRRTDEHKNWADLVIGMAQPEHVATFNVAWQEFLLQKQATIES